MAALLLAVVCSGAMFGMAGWGIPATNQAFRDEADPARRARSSRSGRAALKGPNELTLGELADQMASPDPTYLLVRLSPRQLAAAYHMRWSVSGGTLGLALIAVQLARRRRAQRWTIGAVVSVAYVEYLFSAHRYMYDPLSPIAVAWLPNVAAVAVAVVLSLMPRPAPASGGGPSSPPLTSA